ncbi:MAG TPA: tetratricopeptide repeat protein, partial [Gemmatimonadales bacterium]|nr:tetratricopeptide repeat protein [Gemmatimonadales bacterium]
MRWFIPTLLVAVCTPGNLPAQSDRNTADSILTEATGLLSAGRAWRATRTVSPLLQVPSTRTPATVLVAARAAAGWQGWATVSRLLAGQPWLDLEEGGAGRALLARAAVERGDPTAAAQATLALRGLTDERESGRRLVVLARAFDRAGTLDSASASYQRAAGLLPEVADWLGLRAAGVEADSAIRASLLASVTLPPAARRIRWTEALALERTGNPAAAARLYDQLGATLASIRLRLLATSGDSARRLVRRDLAELLGRSLGPAEARDAIGLMDDYFAPLARNEELAVARRAAAAALLSRSSRGFGRAARSGRLSDPDRYTYGTVLARLGLHRDAIRQFELIRDPGRRAQARYQRARSLFRVGPESRALAALREVRDSFPGSPVTAATAGWLLADFYVDRSDDARARQAFIEVARRYPATSHGQRAAFQAALLAFVAGEFTAAATEFDLIADRSPP